MAKYLDSTGLQNFATLVKSNTVSVNEQTLTSEQKAQARTNIGAGTGNGNVTGSSLTANNIITGGGSSAIQNSGKAFSTATPTSSSTDNQIPTAKAVWAAIDGLDVAESTVGAGKTISKWSETNGKVSITTQDISITKSQISDFPTIPAAAANGTYSVKTKVGDTTTTVSDFTANQSTADDVTFVQGSNITLTPDATNRKITIASTDTNTTYTFANGTNGFTVTPSGGSAQTVTVTPSITNNVTGSAAWTAADKIMMTNAASGNVAKQSGYGVSTTAPSSSSGDDVIPTSKAVWSAISNGIAVADALVYKGTIAGGSTGSYGALTAAANKGWTYKVSTAGLLDGVRVEVGDLVICNTDSTAAATSSNYATIAANWDFIQTNVDGALFKSTNTFTDGQVLAADGTSGKVKTTGYTIAKSVPSNAVFTDTDTKVTSSANHYTPSTASGQDKSASASGATAAWSIDVVKGVTLNTDGKGHVTGISVTSGKIPANPNTDRYVNTAAFGSGNGTVEEVTVTGYGSSGYTLNQSTTTITPVINAVYRVIGIFSGITCPAQVNDYIRVTSVSGTNCWADIITEAEAVGSVKMTLTRAGSDSATVVATLPLATTTSGGIMSASDKIVINNLSTNKADKATTVTNVSYDSTNNKLRKTVNGTTTDIVTAATIVESQMTAMTSTEVTTAWNAG